MTQTSTARATPDVAYDADPNTGFAVYDSYGYSGWLEVGGTSAGAPQWSAIIAIADQAGLPPASRPSPPAAASSRRSCTRTRGDFHDITSGTSTGNPHYSAGPGYDYVTGLGTPMVNLVIGSFGGTSTPTPTRPSTWDLTANQSIYSPNGQYQLIMQGDGNLVEYGPGGQVIWDAGTNGNPGAMRPCRATATSSSTAPPGRRCGTPARMGMPATTSSSRTMAMP